MKTYRRNVLIVLFLLFLASGVHAQTRQGLEEQRKQILLEIEETGRFLAETQRSQRQSLGRLNLLNAQMVQFNRLIAGIEEEVAHADRQIRETSANVSRMTAEIEKMKEEYAQLIHHTYKNRGRYNKLIYVLSAKDFNEAYRRMKYFQQYSEYRKKQVAEIQVRQEELRRVMEQLTIQRTEKEKLLAEHRQESRRLEAVRTEQNKEVNDLRSQERRLRSQLTAQQTRERRLQNEIRKLIEADAKKRSATTANPFERLTPEEQIVSGNFRGNRGRLPWPVEKGIITGFFGNSVHPVLKSPTYNTGIDITTVGGSDVRAVFDGEVVGIVGILGDNLSVLVRHGNYFTVYKNLVAVRVKKGDKIKLKESIGKVYTERGAQTAILHFEIWEERERSTPSQLNPELWLGKN